MENEYGSDRQNPKADEAKEKAEDKKPPQVDPKGGTGDVPPPPPN